MHTEILFKAIGTIHSDFKDIELIPIQPVFAEKVKGYIKIFPEYVEGLNDLDGFSYIYLFFHLHKAPKSKLRVKPYHQDTERGVFATRSPARPNHLGFSLVKLEKIVGNIIYVSKLDILDGTPLIDLKPFIPRLDLRADAKTGWLEDVDEQQVQKRSRQVGDDD